VRGLYRGQQWQASLALWTRASGQFAAVDLWVASAGLGLVAASESAPSYSATFSPGPDRVADDTEGCRKWWSTLLDARGAPTLVELRARYDALLVVLSTAYLQVADVDGVVGDEHVAVVSSTPATGAGRVSSSGLRDALGGSDQTLNARAAAAFLAVRAGAPLGSATAADRWEAWADRRRRGREQGRTPLTDAEVRLRIRRWLDDPPGRSAVRPVGRPPAATRMLRHLRDEGSACSYERFLRLYAETVQETS
jgi:hypothetical protein